MAPTLTSGAAILALVDLPTELVEIPEWGGAVLVRGLTGKERDAYEGEIIVSRKDPRTGALTQDLNLSNARARLVARCVVDASDQRMFTDDQVEALGAKSAAALQRIFDVAQRLSGMREADLKELVGESVPGLVSDSSSASPGISAS